MKRSAAPWNALPRRHPDCAAEQHHEKDQPTRVCQIGRGRGRSRCGEQTGVGPLPRFDEQEEAERGEHAHRDIRKDACRVDDLQGIERKSRAASSPTPGRHCSPSRYITSTVTSEQKKLQSAAGVSPGPKTRKIAAIGKVTIGRT